MSWTAPERRWRDALLDAAVAGRSPAPSTLPDEAWATWHAGASPLLATGFRLTVWLLTWLTVLRWLRPFHRLDATRQEVFLGAVGRSSWWPVRQLATALKLVAATGLARLERP